MAWLFYEEENTWSRSIADVCTTVVNYGVELPWCACTTTTSMINTGVEYATHYGGVASAALGLDQWWTFEMTVALVFFLIEAPFIMLKYRQSGLASTLASIAVVLNGLAYFGCFFEYVSGIQGGVVFGGRLFWPGIFLFGLTIEYVRMSLNVLINECYGREDKREFTTKGEIKMNQFLTSFNGAAPYQITAAFCWAALGWPKMDSNADPTPWLLAFPLLGFMKYVQDSYDIVAPKEAAVPQANGDAVAVIEEKTAEKPKEDAKAKPAEAAPAAAAAPTEEKTDAEKVPEVGGLHKIAARVRALVCCAVSRVISFASCVYAHVMSLPWKLMADWTMLIGTHATLAYVFDTLTGDCATVAVFSLLYSVIPTLLTLDKVSSRLTADQTWALKEICETGCWAAVYYLFKTNITQA